VGGRDRASRDVGLGLVAARARADRQLLVACRAGAWSTVKIRATGSPLLLTAGAVTATRTRHTPATTATWPDPLHGPCGGLLRYRHVAPPSLPGPLPEPLPEPLTGRSRP